MCFWRGPNFIRPEPFEDAPFHAQSWYMMIICYQCLHVVNSKTGVKHVAGIAFRRSMCCIYKNQWSCWGYTLDMLSVHSLILLMSRRYCNYTKWPKCRHTEARRLKKKRKLMSENQNPKKQVRQGQGQSEGETKEKHKLRSNQKTTKNKSGTQGAHEDQETRAGAQKTGGWKTRLTWPGKSEGTTRAKKQTKLTRRWGAEGETQWIAQC